MRVTMRSAPRPTGDGFEVTVSGAEAQGGVIECVACRLRGFGVAVAVEARVGARCPQCGSRVTEAGMSDHLPREAS